MQIGLLPKPIRMFPAVKTEIVQFSPGSVSTRAKRQISTEHRRSLRQVTEFEKQRLNNKRAERC